MITNRLLHKGKKPINEFMFTWLDKETNVVYSTNVPAINETKALKFFKEDHEYWSYSIIRVDRVR